ncbi:GAF domain-containing protein [Streptomyces sp. NPDC004539]|uniref:GAF domain-containing protein n=1 Tax=Streptomyces sp. NPDC004539 TaxID=3154280 RepID=UPI0033BD9335
MNWLGKYWLKVSLLSMSSLLAAAVFTASVVAGDNESDYQDLALWLGMALAVMVVLVTASETVLNEREKNKARNEAVRTAAQLRLLYNNVLAQMSAPLGHLAKEHADAYGATGATPPTALTDAQRDDLKTVLRSVLTGAVTLTAPIDSAGLPTARSAFYRFQAGTNHRFTREPQDWAGRPTPPRLIVDGQDGGHFLHGILQPRTAFHAGTATGLVSVLRPLSTEYRSVIAVPVIAGDREFGVLAVDAPGAGDLTVAHVRLLQCLADILGATLALA